MNENELLERKKAVHLVENMDEARLIEFIAERLKRIRIVPPLCTSSDERPAYFLEKVYEKSKDDKFKSKFRNAIAKLLTFELLEISDPDYLAALLIFCEQFIIPEAVEPVGGMALGEKLKGISSTEGDLHHRVLMALARMPRGLKMTDIWVDAIEDPRYTSAAFAALREQGLEEINKYIPRFGRMYHKNPGSIDLKIALLTLYEEFRDTVEDEIEITNRITGNIENEDQGVINTINSTLESIGKKNSPLEIGDLIPHKEKNSKRFGESVKYDKL